MTTATRDGARRLAHRWERVRIPNRIAGPGTLARVRQLLIRAWRLARWLTFRKLSGRCAWRLARWVGVECLWLARDLAGVFNWCRYEHTVATLRATLTTALAVPLVVIFAPAFAARAGVWAALAYTAAAVVTAVPRGRARVRRRIRQAVRAVVGHKMPVHRPKRCRWRPGTYHLLSAEIRPPFAWRDGSDRRRDDLEEQVAWRLASQGAFRLDWTHRYGQPVARVLPAPPVPPRVRAADWTPPANAMLIGVTHEWLPKVHHVDGYAFACWRWDRDPHLLVTGATGEGKSATLRWLVRALRAAAVPLETRMQFAAFDGKQSAAFAFLAGREGVLGVADDPGEWVALIERVHAELERRRKALRAWRNGQGPRPSWEPIGVLVDELVDIREVAREAFMDPYGEVVRLGREFGIHCVSSVLRPDVAASLPGLVRASHSARLLLGTGHDPQSVEMAIGPAGKQTALAGDGEQSGRGLLLSARKLYEVQVPLEPDPYEHPRAGQDWLPPREGVGEIVDLDEARSTRRDRRGSPEPEQSETDEKEEQLQGQT